MPDAARLAHPKEIDARPHRFTALDRLLEMTALSAGRLDPVVSRERFMEIVAELRPDLHRFCARMMGSIVEGEDVAQEALTRAFASLSELERASQVRAWLFRIAHNHAIDHLRATSIE
jgi:hypothetical protein